MFIAKLDKDVKSEKVIWDLVSCGKITLKELENDYNFDDLQRFLAVDACNSDYRNYLERKAQQKAKSRG